MSENVGNERNLAKARVLCIRGRYDEALKIYEEILDEDFECLPAYIGLLRAHSENFTVYDGAAVEKDLYVLKQITRGKDTGESEDEEYAEYLAARKNYLDTGKTSARDTEEFLSKKEAGDLFSHYTEENLNKAFKSIKHYAELGDAEFQQYLASYYDGTSPNTVVKPNVETAYYWFRKSAEQGNEDSQFFVGQCLYEGVGCTQNKAEGLQWLKKSAQQNCMLAQFYLEDLGEKW